MRPILPADGPAHSMPECYHLNACMDERIHARHREQLYGDEVEHDGAGDAQPKGTRSSVGKGGIALVGTRPVR